ncbi:MAG: four helix bundle protein [Hyphomicrobiaceae bacterium]|nr:four helix bundle protein [Hyphomicrobiaceae bacterium]
MGQPAEYTIRSYRDLVIWQKAMDVAVSCYELTAKFPKDELYGLAAQIRRASASVAANVAEGHGRENTGSFIQFLRVSQGSLKELETHVMLAERVGIVPKTSTGPLLAECESIGRMLRSLIRSLQQKS